MDTFVSPGHGLGRPHLQVDPKGPQYYGGPRHGAPRGWLSHHIARS